MRHVPSIGVTDREIIDFFSRPIHEISLSRQEGNRVFESLIVSSSEERFSIYSSIVELSDGDEIGVLSIERTDKKVLENKISLPELCKIPTSIQKIVGDYDVDGSCECGLLIETSAGMISFFSGSFPASLNIVCPGFDQGLRVTSFQKFKYHLRPLKVY